MRKPKSRKVFVFNNEQWFESTLSAIDFQPNASIGTCNDRNVMGVQPDRQVDRDSHAGDEDGRDREAWRTTQSAGVAKVHEHGLSDGSMSHPPQNALPTVAYRSEVA